MAKGGNKAIATPPDSMTRRIHPAIAIMIPAPFRHCVFLNLAAFSRVQHPD
jgi:hypothetical protein